MEWNGMEWNGEQRRYDTQETRDSVMPRLATHTDYRVSPGNDDNHNM